MESFGLAILAQIILIGGSVAIARCIKEREMRQAIAKHGAGKYTVDPVTGKKYFVFINGMEVIRQLQDVANGSRDAKATANSYINYIN